MSTENTPTPIGIEQARKPTTGRAIAIQYDRTGRYHERTFNRTKTANGESWENGFYSTSLPDLLERDASFNAAMRKAGFDPDADIPKAYAIPDGMRLFRWALKDGTVVTTGTDFPRGPFVQIRTLDGRNMFIPTSNIAYIIEVDGGGRP